MKILLYSIFAVLTLDLTFAKRFSRKHKKPAKGIKLRKNCKNFYFFEEQDITEEVDAKLQFFARAWNNDDWHVMDQVYSRDVICMSQGFPVAKGLEELTELFKLQAATGEKLTLTTYQAYQMSNTRAYHIDYGRVFDKDGNILVENSRALGIWIKEDDDWKIHIELINNF